MEILNKKQKIVLIIIVSLVIFFIGYYIIKKTKTYSYNNLEIFEEENNIDTTNIDDNEEKKIIEENIIVHISGEVVNNGIIEIEKNARIADVINKAGGTTKEADLSKVNLAYKVNDGQKIYIPNINERENKNIEGTKQYITDGAGDNIIIEGKTINDEKININTATQTELETLSGVGPSTALKIINYRKENGKFKKIEDLKNVPGIGEAKFNSIKENICIK